MIYLERGDHCLLACVTFVLFVHVFGDLLSHFRDRTQNGINRCYSEACRVWIFSKYQEQYYGDVYYVHRPCRTDCKSFRRITLLNIVILEWNSVSDTKNTWFSPILSFEVNNAHLFGFYLQVCYTIVTAVSWATRNIFVFFFGGRR